MAPYHRAFGLTIEALRPIPGLEILAHAEKVNVKIDFEERGQGRYSQMPQQIWYESPSYKGGILLRVFRLEE